MKPAPYKTDLAVMHPVRMPAVERSAFRLRLWHALPILLFCIFYSTLGFAEAQNGQLSAFDTLLRWMPLLLKGFGFNLLISVMAMSIGTVIGVGLGLGQISLNAGLSRFSWFVTQFFRNSPWLVLLFFAMFLLPFEMNIAGFTVPLPDWVKATFGLSLPVMANVSEIVRGAVKSLPSG